MVDDEFKGPELSPIDPATIHAHQLSLSELFFVVTLVAVEVGIYLHVSSLLAFTIGGGMLLLAIIRFADIHNFLLGSIVGYGVAFLVAWLYILTCNASLIPAVSALIFFPACGYLLGAILADSQNFS